MLVKINDNVYVNKDHITHIDFYKYNYIEKENQYMVLVYITNHEEESINAGMYKTEKEAKERIEQIVSMINDIFDTYQVYTREDN